MNDLILQPILFMGMLSLVMMLLMYITRIPPPKCLRRRASICRSSLTRRSWGVFPSKVERFADNYNHLWEQPTLFYAVVLVIWALGHTDSAHLIAAWTYCGLRCVHSIVQVTINHVWVRFSLFILSWVALATMLIREVLAALG